MMSSPATRSMSKRHSTSPVARTPAKRPATRSTTRRKSEPPITITQPDEMEWETSAVEERAKATEREENIETTCTDCHPEDGKPPAIDTNWFEKDLECD